jgi:hypothetical protein
MSNVRVRFMFRVLDKRDGEESFSIPSIIQRQIHSDLQYVYSDSCLPAGHIG